MQTTELQLFQASQSIDVNSIHKETPSPQPFEKPLDILDNAFRDIFSPNTEEAVVTRMRRILGEKAKTLSDEQIECVATEFNFLIDAWLDEYEKEVFEGMTLKEVLNEK